MQFDLTEMNIGELADFEEVTGRDPMNLPAEFNPTVKDILAFAWIMGKRSNPAMTLEEARAIRLEDLAELVPTPAGGVAGADPSGRSSSSGSRNSRKSTGSRRTSSGR